MTSIFALLAERLRRRPKSASSPEYEPPGGHGLWVGGDDPSLIAVDNWRPAGLPEDPSPTRSPTA
jgi:hypothetical protein